MFETIGALVEKVVAALGSAFWDWYKRPTVSLPRAPANIFEHLKPHTALAKAREVLGTPTREGKAYLSFKFSDAFIQIGSEDGKAIDALWVVLPKMGRRATFKVYPLEFVLGTSSIADAFFGEEPEYEYDSSSKHWQLSATQYFGYDGHYLHYVFGVIGAPHIAPPDVDFVRGEEGALNAKVKSPAAKVIPNMVCVTSQDPKRVIFDFWAFH